VGGLDAESERNLRNNLIGYVQFWPRLEKFRSFVLNELRRFLNVRQFRLEIRSRGSKLRAYLWLESSGLIAGGGPELALAEALDDIQF
jgi:hypothetical protein